MLVTCMRIDPWTFLLCYTNTRMMWRI